MSPLDILTTPLPVPLWFIFPTIVLASIALVDLIGRNAAEALRIGGRVCRFVVGPVVDLIDRAWPLSSRPDLDEGHFSAADWVTEPLPAPWTELPLWSDGTWAAPTIHYQNPQTGHLITVVGVSHVANASCWSVLLTEVHDWINAGGVLHSEGFRDVPSPRTLRRFGAYFSLINEIQHHVTITGYEGTPQSNLSLDPIFNKHVQYRDSAAGLPLRHVSEHRMKLAEDMLRLLAPTLLRDGASFESIEAELERLGVLPAVAQMLNERNDVAVAAAVAEPDPVMMIWGSSHLPGIDDLLVESGYEMQYWRTRRFFSPDDQSQDQIPAWLEHQVSTTSGA